jgi:hypothetical protein
MTATRDPWARTREAVRSATPKMQPPPTPEEIALVRKAAYRYRSLIKQLETARDELNNYLSDIKKQLKSIH